MCSLSYKGYPRFVKETHDDAAMVSAIGNVLALRFYEGDKSYAFCTHFPKEWEVKNLAQVRNSKCFILFAQTTNMSFTFNHQFSSKAISFFSVEHRPTDPDFRVFKKKMLRTRQWRQSHIVSSNFYFNLKHKKSFALQIFSFFSVLV